MLSETEISAASGTLTATQIKLLVLAVRRSKLYIENPTIFSGISSLISGADAETTKILNAAYAKLTSIVGVGSVDVFLRSDEGLDYAQRREIDYWLGYMISSLYTVSEGNFVYDATTATWLLLGGVSLGGFRVGRRELSDEFI